jgi:SpoVK/Ycf46/Vps4 family AAA+-type ATPase
LVTNRNGPPGVGKSLTAECIAEYAKKPIIPLSVGNLVAVEDSIEERLIEAFANASRLGAILLLDEADVVLEARSFEEIRINGIVSGSHTLYPKAKDAFTKIYVVFLRQLEYYSGMLFLTTNRINSMDHAFQSRIQIAIPYTELTRTQREAVWTSLLNSNLIDVTEHDKAIITETLKLAFFLALHDITSDRKVQLKHIEKALKEALQFQEFFEEGKRNSKNKNSVWKPFAPSHTGDY